MIKILVVSDIHYPDRITKIPDIKEIAKDCDGIICLGDYTKREVLDYLKSIAKNFFGIYGNMDEDKVKNELTRVLYFSIENIKIGLFHGNGGPSGIEERVRKELGDRVDAYIFGHTHKQACHYIFEKFYFNPGALSGPDATYGYLFVEQNNIWGEIHRLTGK